METVYLRIPDALRESLTGIAGIDANSINLPIATILDDSDELAVSEALDYFAALSSKITGKVSAISRNFGENTDAVVIELFSENYDFGYLDFIFWLYDINGLVNDRLSIELMRIEKADKTPDISVSSESYEFRELLYKDTTRDLAVKVVGVGEMTANNKLIMTESVAKKDGRLMVEMRIRAQYDVSAYPSIPLPSDITEGSGEMFITLPVAAFGAESLNGHTYLESSVRDMLNQINDRRPESNWGHIPDHEFSTRYGAPPVRWLAAVEQGGTIFARGRVLTDEARTYYARADMDKARVGTSLFAWVEMEDDRVTHMDLITIDLADPARVGVPLTAARPSVSVTEMGKNRAGVEEMLEAKMRELLGLDETADLEATLSTVIESSKKSTALEQEKAALEQEKAAQSARIEALTAQTQEWAREFVRLSVPVELARKTVLDLIDLSKVETIEQAKEQLKDIKNRPDVIALIKVGMTQESGEPHKRGNDDGTSKGKFFTIPERGE